jgi:hypothetical protein
MADKKISALTSLAQGDVAASTDVLPIVDTSATETKKITASALVGAGMTAGVTNVDINSGSIDGTTIGANSAAAGTFTNLTASGTVSFSGATVSNGGAVTTIDINGGTIDATSIGASSASTGAFTTLTTSSTVTLNGGTANGVLYLNGSKVATSGSALSFDGTILQQATGGSAAVARFGSTISSGRAATISLGSNAGVARGTISLDAGTEVMTIGPEGNFPLLFQVNGSEAMRLTSSTLYTASGINVGIGTSSLQSGTRLTLQESASNPSGLAIRNRNSTQTWQISVDAAAVDDKILAFIDPGAGAVRMALDSSGNLGIGTSSPATLLDLGTSTGQKISVYRSATIRYGFGIETDTMRYYVPTGASNAVHSFGQISTTDGTTYTERMRLDSSGNLGLGVTPSTSWFSSSKAIQIGSAGAPYMGLAQQTTTTCDGYMLWGARLSGDRAFQYTTTGDAVAAYRQNAGTHAWFNAASGTAGNTISSFTQAMTLDAAGDLCVKKTTADATTEGAALQANGRGIFTSNSATECILANRQDSDGTLVDFRQANTTEGSISVSGNTVSYNAFAGSHWSQLQDGSKPDILRGTVMESINELCVWPGENNERLPKSKISDTVGSKKVYGVFMAWDNDWTATNDMYVTAVGAFICRVNASVTVQEGDLLESNGDGTARVQADDIIRSSTIGKVTSTVKTHQYDDGSYCVPTVLYCG